VSGVHHRGRLRLLLATSSVAALALAGTVSASSAASTGCSSATLNTGTVGCILYRNSNLSGQVGNGTSGVVTRTGISVLNSTIAGSLIDSGTLFGGIAIGAASTITASANGNTGDAVYVSGPSFSGGISNAGTLFSALEVGIHVSGVSTFSGSIDNSGTILASQIGIDIYNVTAFGSSVGGGISNAGAILVLDAVGYGAFGIYVNGAQSFAGGITNSGSIRVANFEGGQATGIYVSGVSTFTGGIRNSGTIDAIGFNGGFSSENGFSEGGGIFNEGESGSVALVLSEGGITNSGIATFNPGIVLPIGILASNASLFTGGVINSGTINVGAFGYVGSATGIKVASIATFMGGISNSGSISVSTSFIGEPSNVGGIGIEVTGVTAFSGGITNSGTMSANTGILLGSGISTFSGAIANSGTISATTAIDVSRANNAITIDQSGGLITGDIKLSPNADVLNISGGAIVGNIVGQGSSDTINFNLGAGGTFTYGSNTYGFTDINTVNVNSGTAILNGDVNAATTVNVNHGGTLAGTSTLDPLSVTIFSGGTLEPGTPGVPGTSMTIDGNLTFQPGANYLVNIGPNAVSIANVTGSATLNGASLEGFFAPGSYNNKTTYDLLNASSVSGTFSGFTAINAPGFGGTLNADGLLSLTAQIGAGGGLPVNQQSIANKINTFFNSGGTLPAAFFPAFGLNQGSALSQLDGEDATGAERSAFDLMNTFLGLVLDPSIDGRSGHQSGGGALGFAPDQQENLPPDIALAYAGLLKAPPQQNFDRRWTAWGTAFGGSGTTDGDPAVGSNNVTTSTYGFAGGLDYHYSPDTTLGIALAGGGTGWNLTQGLGTGRSDAFLASAYGVTHEGPWYVAGALAFANNWFNTSRSALGDQVTASFQGQSYSARLEGGYRFVVPVQHSAIGVTPYAALQAQDFHTPAYSETDLSGGGLGLSYDAMSGTDTRSELGTRFDDLTTLNNLPLMLRAKLAWAHDWASDPALNAAFEALPGSSFTVNGAPIPHDSALTSAGAQLFFTPDWSFLVKFDGAFAPGSQTYAGSGTLHYTW
jgi:uncharacterized protein with beta-barrel porin domain